MTISPRGVEVERFWNSIPRAKNTYNEASLIEEYRGLLDDAVGLQLRSDVPVGLFLSSGIDSGALLAIMSEYSHRPVHAFTIGFEGGEKGDEVSDARSLAKRFGADHHFMVVRPEDYLNYYKDYLWDLEEPVGNETAAAFYFVSKMTRETVKVALTGQGADEPWAGYDRYLGAKLSALYSRIPSIVRTPLAAIVNQIPGRFERLKRGVNSLGEPDVLTRFVKMYSFFSEEMKQQLFRGPLADQIADDRHMPKEALRRLQADVQHLDPLSQMLYIDTRASLPDDLLMVGDKTSMANSLEVRVPFLDYRLVEFIERLPPRLKLNWLTGKYLHKRALEKWLPKDVVYRKKKGFANPIEDWFRTKMRPFVEECLLSSGAAVGQYFDQKYICHLLQLDRDGKEQFRRHIYLMVSFELWHRTFIRN
jgi:asparagine synthase (glutamine-hydrolysing)